MRRTRRRRGRRRKPLSRRWERKRQRYILQEAQTSVRYYLSYIPMIAVWIFRVAGICVFAFLIVWHLGQRVSMIGDSMNPILRNGDVVLVNRLVYNARRPRRGDIIVFKPKGNENSHYYIKRVIGLPGEKVEFRENEIYINGNRLEEKYQSTAVDRTGIVTEKMELGSDEYFVLGDDRENSEDSRDADVGNVKREHIFGKAWFVISPRDSFGFIKEQRTMHFQWYPGHMTKAKRMMQENIKLVDLVIELVDARIPVSSRNPDIDGLGGNKARLILLNKADLAEEKWNDAWIAYFEERGISAVKVNSRKSGGLKPVHSVILSACKEKIERDRRRGILNRPVRAMVAGIPNVGKSTFINTLAGKACARTGNKPGVTKGKQWIRLNKQVELLDTPGILWPKFEDQTVGLKLAYIGSIKDEILNTEELGTELIRFLCINYPGVLEEKYQIECSEDAYGTLNDIAESRHCLLRAGELDTEKAALLLLDDFRSGRLGRLTLEYPA